MSDLILYTTEDGKARIEMRADGGTAWMPPSRLAELFERDKSVISRHISNILDEGELDAKSVVAEYATSASDGKTCQVTHYNLDMILAPRRFADMSSEERLCATCRAAT